MPAGKLRIVAGRWRGSKIVVREALQLRPTPERVRETLFNWLQGRIEGARGLDLFAGSGALALEALSRGARSAVCVERNPQLCRDLVAAGERLGAQNLEVYCSDALQWLRKNSVGECDVVFLDPPYRSDLLQRALGLLHGRLASSALVYLESHQPLQEMSLPLPICRRSGAGAVHYALLGGDGLAGERR